MWRRSRQKFPTAVFMRSEQVNFEKVYFLYMHSVANELGKFSKTHGFSTVSLILIHLFVSKLAALICATGKGKNPPRNSAED